MHDENIVFTIKKSPHERSMPKFINWVPTRPDCIDAFFEMAPLSSSDIVYDLGSGDGRLLFAALEKGAGKCVGIDIDNERVTEARKTAKDKDLEDKIRFVHGDVTDTDLSSASVVLCYLYPSASYALRSKLEEELKPGTRVIMEAFPVPGWIPEQIREIQGGKLYLYTMPIEKTEDYDDAINNLDFVPYYEYPDEDV
jgi:SAM-dependent methyltransferase